MKILLTGASGFVGRAAAAHFTGLKHEVVGVSRSVRPAAGGLSWITWDALPEVLPGCDAVIHLAGENVFGGLWTDAAKRRILESRTASTRRIARLLRENPGQVKLFLSASAVGFYGDCGTDPVDEQRPAGPGFLAEVCQAWEDAALEAAPAVPVSIARIGVVLERDGGALAKMIPQFNLFAGGAAGGSQLVPWIHRHDLVRAFAFALEHRLEGAWNAVGPAPVTMSELADALGAALHRPALLHAPAFLLKLVLGEAASAILQSARVMPARLLASGFAFDYPEIGAAMRAVIAGRTAAAG